ncbi:TIR domain-containing protein [Nocardia terpenica]|uniref:toll/interleukin-1 receptor domain-containing protein n=1 Tax=Nocardia terpenica TaxID=455432 RepID=UPI0018931D0D|nr:toll/interleukin-1 receptor domain-containing protein [Nocardia terpenica]MBF6061377.1 TIR domain-containing protein [Nocardia terpenica]MBF6105394.1 TIR domain-containing protein [Nocardia terpenica]MBF6113136.1 TIR domain-containing protein [Nocardia terpenica]MBF6119266.1 TIR domain-containing protein [Nocardia terpenica]MBF6152914.1 TIR domain-containing protein [Nocardia terpenica]
MTVAAVRSTLLRYRLVRADTGYGAFFSYSGDRDRRLLPRLQRAIEKQSRPWYRPPRVRIFLDYSGISVGPRLRAKIEAGLARSRWLVVIASPEARRSTWVDREIDWWLTHRSVDTLLLVVSDGALVWDERRGDWDPDRSTALPPRLLGTFPDEPVWKTIPWHDSGRDPDIDSAAVSIAAVVRGMREDDLTSEGLRDTRRNLRWARAVALVLAALLVAAAVIARIAVGQKNTADDQARIASTRLMASVADGHATTDARAALLLAVAAYRTAPDPNTLAALYRANLASPTLVRGVTTPAPITQLETSADGRTAVAGLGDGQLVAWTATDRTLAPITSLAPPLSSIAVSADATVIAAAAGTHLRLWRKTGGPLDLAVPDGLTPQQVTVLPSGAVVAVQTTTTAPASGALLLYDSGSGRLQSRFATDTLIAQAGVPGLGVRSVLPLSDDDLLLLDHAYWVRIRVRDGTVEETGIGELPDLADGLIGRPSGNGELYSASNNGGATDIYRLHGPKRFPADDIAATLSAITPATGVEPPAVLDRNGDTAALLAPDGSIYLAPIAAAATPRPAAVRLTGAQIRSGDLIRFLGDSGHRVLAATGDHLILWDTDQIDRLSVTAAAAIPQVCNACPRPTVQISPTDTEIIVSSGVDNGQAPDSTDIDREENAKYRFTVVRPLPLSSAPGRSVPVDGMPAWPDPAHPVLLTHQRAQPDSPTPPPLAVLTAPSPEAVLSGAWSGPDPATVLSLDANGTLSAQNTSTGAITAQRTAPAPATGYGPVVSNRRFAAYLSRRGVTIVDSATLGIAAHLDGRDVTALAYAGPQLLIHRGRDLEVWTENGSTLLRTLTGIGPPGHWESLAADDAATVVAHLDDAGSILLDDLRTGTNLATIPGGPAAAGMTGLALSHNGKHLLTATGSWRAPDGTLTDHDIAPDTLVRTACDRAGTDLTPQEWRDLVGIRRPPTASCP